MDTELKNKWLAALRNGEYKQATGYLKTQDGFCCLGVLCDIIDPDAWDNKLSGLENRSYAWDSGGFGKSYYELPNHVLHDIGVPRYHEAISVEENSSQLTQSYLANKNDGGASFSDLADWIEENL